MIRRFALTTVLGAAAAAALVSAPAVATSAPGVALTAMAVPADNQHGPDWDGRHGQWDGRGGFGHGGGWDGNGGGWDGHRWWVSADRCNRGGGHVDRTHDRWHNFFCRGGRFNGAPVHR